MKLKTNNQQSTIYFKTVNDNKQLICKGESSVKI